MTAFLLRRSEKESCHSEPLDLHSELFNKKNNDVNFLFASFSFVNKFNFVNNLRKERGELYSELS